MVLRPSKVIRVEQARSSSVSFSDEGTWAARKAGRPRSFSSSEDTVPVNSPDSFDKQMLPRLNLDSATIGNDTMMAVEEVKRAMRDMVSDQANLRLNTALNELTDEDVKKASANSNSCIMLV